MNSRHGSRLLGLPSEDIVMKKARALELPAERLTGVVGCSVCRCAVPVYCSRKSERAAAGAGAVLLVSLLLRLVLPKRPGELLVNCGCSGLSAAHHNPCALIDLTHSRSLRNEHHNSYWHAHGTGGGTPRLGASQRAVAPAAAACAGGGRAGRGRAGQHSTGSGSCCITFSLLAVARCRPMQALDFSPRFLPADHPPEQELSAEALPGGTPALCSGPVSRFAKPMAREEVLLDGIVPPTIVNTR